MRSCLCSAWSKAQLIKASTTEAGRAIPSPGSEDCILGQAWSVEDENTGGRFKGGSIATADVTMPPFTSDSRFLDHLWVAERGWLAAEKKGQRGKWDRGHWDISRQNISTRQQNHQGTEGSMGNRRSLLGNSLGGMLFHTREHHVSP